MSQTASMTIEKKAAVKNGVSRMVFAAISILLEIIAIVVIFYNLNEYAEWISIGTRVAALILVLTIYGRHITSSMKMPWIMLIMAFPVVGVILYLTIGLNISTKKMKRNFKLADEQLLPALPDNENALESLKSSHPKLYPIAHYLKLNASYPLYDDTQVTYYSEASDGLEAQLNDLAKAKKFIFMEYHAIENKESFHRVRDVLARRAKEGVEVRIFYDDMGSIGFINTDFVKEMAGYGIKCRVFNPFSPGLNIFLNNRDHRKITVIDGKVGFTGGYNIANEYFNLTHPYGYWKDTGIRLEGNAVKSLTAAFLEMWNAIGKDEEADRDFAQKYMPAAPMPAAPQGWIQPYADSPIADPRVGEDIYISVVEQASDYAWFITPYLIITEEMIHTLGIAARRGIDVRIITPGIPDKKMIYGVTRSYYNALVRHGVRIYEYTPGFCHCKMSVSDDVIATCGTINLDYRSLYHHFENGCVMYDNHAVDKIKEDFIRIMEESREVTEKYASGRNSFLRAWQLILRLFAPLM